MQNLWNMMNAPMTFGEQSFGFSLLTLVTGMVLPLFLIWLGYRILRLAARRVMMTAEATDELQKTVLLWLRRVYLAVFPLLAIAFAGGLMGAEIFGLVGRIVSVLNEPFFESGTTRLSVVTLLLLIPVFSAASWAAHLAKQAVESRFLARIGVDPARRFSIASLVRYVVLIVAVVIGLSVIGINLSSLAVMIGVLGIGVGFGLQGVVANFFAGIVIILTRPLKEGDRILVHDYEGTVYQIRMISTVINTLTNETIIVPNSELVNRYIHNYSYEDISIIIVNMVQVSYTSDLDRVEQVLRAVSMENPYRMDGRDPRVFFRSFDDSGITVSVGTWIRDARDRMLASSWTTLEIWRAFRKHGIEIPFPQRDVHLRTVPPVDMPATAAPKPGAVV
jgi:potassium-dependent mechanosensitive channel